MPLDRCRCLWPTERCCPEDSLRLCSQLSGPRRSVRYACACITPCRTPKAPSDLARSRNCRAQRPLDLGPPSLTDCCALPHCSSPAADAATTPPQRAAETRLAACACTFVVLLSAVPARSRCTPLGAHPLAGSLSPSFSRACGGTNTLRLSTPAGSTPSGITHPRDNTPKAPFIGSPRGNDQPRRNNPGATTNPGAATGCRSRRSRRCRLTAQPPAPPGTASRRVLYAWSTRSASSRLAGATAQRARRCVPARSHPTA